MYLYGASGHGKVIIDIIKSSTDIVIEAVFDDNEELDSLLDIPVIKFNADTFNSDNELIVTVGNNEIRKKIAENVKATYVKVVHKSAVISNYSKVGVGTVIMPNCVVNANTKIGKHCIINSRVVIEHDCVLEDYVHVSPNASLAGDVKVGEGSHIGIGATVIQGIKIGKWATIGAGTVVINNVPDGAVVVGVPGRIVSK